MALAPPLTVTTMAPDPPATHTVQLVLSVAGMYLLRLKHAASQLTTRSLCSLTEQDVSRRQCTGLNCNGSGPSSDGNNYGPGSASNPYGPIGSQRRRYVPCLPKDHFAIHGSFSRSSTEQDVARRQCTGLNCNGSGSSSDGDNYGPGSAGNNYGPIGSN